MFGFLAPTAGSARKRSRSAAETARAALAAKAVAAPKAFQRRPKRTLAGRAQIPTTRWNHPKAVPLREAGTKSATIARSAPSQAAAYNPYRRNTAVVGKGPFTRAKAA